MPTDDEDFAKELRALGLEYTQNAEGEFQVYAGTEDEAQRIMGRLIRATEAEDPLQALLDGPSYEFRIEAISHAVYSHTVQITTPWSPWWLTQETG
jgi:hypothetical protein